jgi:hypothetical protein
MLDLIISVDTSLAHVVGAMGKPVWILLPFSGDFRWLLDREDSPWCPDRASFPATRYRRLGDRASPRPGRARRLAHLALDRFRCVVNRRLTTPSQNIR